MYRNKWVSHLLLSWIKDHNLRHKQYKNYGENWVSNRNSLWLFTLRPMVNQKDLIKKLSSTYISVETSNRMTGPHYSLLLNLHIIHNPIAVHRKHHSKFGMGSNPPLNHLCIYKQDYKV